MAPTGLAQTDEAHRSIRVVPSTASQAGLARAPGGGAQADFDSLIDLIVATVAPDTWDDVGGDGSIQGFPGGVYVDAKGTLRQLDQNTQDLLAPHWRRWNSRQRHSFANHNIAHRSPLRKVSLVRLLHRCQQLHKQQLPPTDAMLHMAGLERIDYLVFDPDTSDCIVAGPAGPWFIDDQGRHVVAPSRRPAVRLEDLVVLLRNSFFAQGNFLCTITPTQNGLVDAQRYIAQSAGRPIAAGKRDEWLQGFRSALGLQEIEVQGIDANTRVARVIVEADHHMKQIGIGLQPGTEGVPSYLDRIVTDGGLPMQMDVLRWWFTLHPEAVQVAECGTLFVFGEQAVQVLSENELLTQHGQRIHTGQSDPRNERFARDFTEEFERLAERYPVYADLDNIFRLSLVAAVICQHGLPNGTALDLPEWLKSNSFTVTTARAPAWVESVVNHRQIDRRQFVAAVSGGVRFDSPPLHAIPESATRPAALDWKGSGIRGESTWWWD